MLGKEARLIGILSENKLTGSIGLDEVRTILNDGLQLAPYLEPLLHTLKKKYHAEEKLKFPVSHLVLSLKDFDFLCNLPKNVNSRERSINLKLIKAGVVIYKRNLMSVREINNCMNAFSIMERDTLYIHGNIKLDPKVIGETLMLADKVMCEQLIKLWIEDVDSSHLFEYYDAERVVIERQINKEKFGTENPVPTLFPHEFLFLCCNCQNRKELMQQVQKKKMFAYRDNSTDTFPLDPAAHLNYWPSEKIEDLLRNEYEQTEYKMKYKGTSKRREKKKLVTKIRAQKQKPKNLSFKSRDFQKIIAGPDLYKEIKRQVVGSNRNVDIQRLGKKESNVFENITLVPNPLLELKKNPEYYKLQRLHPSTYSKLSLSPKKNIRDENRRATTAKTSKRREQIAKDSTKLKFSTLEVSHIADRSNTETHQIRPNLVQKQISTNQIEKLQIQQSPSKEKNVSFQKNKTKPSGKTPLGFKKKDKMLMQSIIVGSKKKKTHSKLIQKCENIFDQELKNFESPLNQKRKIKTKMNQLKYPASSSSLNKILPNPF